MPRKLTYDEIKTNIESEGYILLSDSYENNNTRLTVKCLNGHVDVVTWGRWKNGRRCPSCSPTKKLTHEFVKQSFESEGYQLLSPYISANEKVHYRCKEGHEHSITWGSWYLGRRCPECAGKIIHQEDVMRSFEVEGYQLLSEYKNNRGKLDFICPQDHKHSIIWLSWQQGHRCAICAGKAVDQIKTRQLVEQEGYTLITDIVKSDVKFDYICPKGHKHSMLWGNWTHGNRCPSCVIEQTVSKPEKEVCEYVKSIIPYPIEENNRTIIINERTGRYLELDIFVPTLNKAIEFNGVYWHSQRKAINNDKTKKRKCEELGIPLMVVLDTEWNNDRDSCQDKIREFLGVGV